MNYARLPDLQAWAAGQMQRAPDFIIGPEDDPYMHRWWVIPRNEQMNVYLHKILRSDDDRALHDHPWDNTSFVIAGGYVEHMPLYPGSYSGPGRVGDEVIQAGRSAGDVVSRSAEHSHRLELLGDEPAISLFMTGPKLREWGFWCDHGWRPHYEFTGGANGGLVGRGCD